MNQKITPYLIGIFIFFTYFLQAQSVRRSVICSIGATETVGETLVRSTVGQPPNVGTVFSADNYLRQGFQQPSSCVTAPKAAFAIDLQGQAVCGGPYRFFYMDNARDETTFNWNFGLGAVPDTSAEQHPEGIIYYTPGLKDIVLTVTTGDCENTASLDLNIHHAALTADVATLDLFCLEDADGAINLFIEGGTAPYQVQWATGETGQDLMDIYPGTYAYSITDLNNCMLEGEEEVTGPADSLQVELTILDESCHGNADGTIDVLVSGGTAPYQYAWTNGETTTSLDELTAGNYFLSLTDDNNCLKIVPVVVNVACEALQFYEVITPNGDGQNDFWEVEGIQNFPINELQVYNRWGEIIYEVQNYNNTWQGTDKNGKQLPFGTYYFVLSLNDESGKKFTGAVSVLR